MELFQCFALLNVQNGVLRGGVTNREVVWKWEITMRYFVEKLRIHNDFNYTLGLPRPSPHLYLLLILFNLIPHTLILKRF
jgi:hypothetical protein